MFKNYSFCILLFLCSLFSSLASSQSSPRDIYLEAENQYDLGDYSQALNLLNQVEDILSDSNPLITSLRVKSYYQLGQNDSALDQLSIFSSYSNVTDATRQEMDAFRNLIEEASADSGTFSFTSTSNSFISTSNTSEIDAFLMVFEYVFYVPAGLFGMFMYMMTLALEDLDIPEE